MKSQVLTTLLATAATVAAGVYATPALAFDLVPQQEGEIDVGLGCYDTCIQLDPIFESIVSLHDWSTGSKSRLFVDNLATSNTYNAGGSNELYFNKRDAGTNQTGYVFRPSEYNIDSDYSEETGQLEVGTYTFNFSRAISELTIDFWDTESVGTGIMSLNGERIREWIDPGSNNNLQSRTFYDVTSITLNLGNDTANGTGDGVNFTLNSAHAPDAATPEPFSMIGAGLALGAGALLKKRK
ncbi:MAG: LEVG family PEP-CTERM protein [Cyanobacteria bacterium P01_G01_bin.54]